MASPKDIGSSMIARRSLRWVFLVVAIVLAGLCVAVLRKETGDPPSGRGRPLSWSGGP